MKNLVFTSLFILITTLVSSFAAQAASVPTIQSFKQWKGEKIQTVFTQWLQLRAQILKTKGDALVKTTLEKDLAQVQWHLDIAKDLSVADYFVMYLSRQSQADRFHLAAQKLSTAEVAELMKAYAAELESANPPEPITGVTSRAKPSLKLPIQATQN